MPGLKVVQPSTPHDAKGLLLAAIADPDPVMIFEHKLLYKMKGPVPEGHYTVPLGKARSAARGQRPHDRRDLDHGAPARWRPPRRWRGEGIDIEVVDLRTLRPMDKATIIASVKQDLAAALRLRRR